MSTYTVKGAQWNQDKVSKHRRVKHSEPGYSDYVHSEPSQKISSTFKADFVVEIDIEKIINLVVGRSMHSKTGKSRMLNGLIKATRKNEVTLSTTVISIPLRLGYVEVKP